MPTRNTKWLLAAVLYVASADQTMHQKIRTNHPVLIRRVDKVLSSFLAIVSHALFAIILALVLVVLVGSGTISAINAVSIGIAWLIAVVWMAKSDLIMRLPVPSRLCVILVAGICLAFAGMKFSAWSTKQWKINNEGSQRQAVIPNISPTEPNFAIRMTSLVTNGALMLWARDNNDSHLNYFCRVPILAEIYLTNNQMHWTIITRLHVEAMDVDGQWRSLGVIDTLAVSPIYKGLNMRHVQPIKPVDGKYLDQQIVGKNIGPGETASGWLFLTQDLTQNIKGPLKFSLSDIHGSSYTIGPISVDGGGDNAGLLPGGFETEEGFADLSRLKQEDCPAWR